LTFAAGIQRQKEKLLDSNLFKVYVSLEPTDSQEHGDVFLFHALLRRSDEKKDISMLRKRFLSPITLKRHSASSSGPKGSWPRRSVGVMC
jgi:hypothetical protein